MLKILFFLCLFCPKTCIPARPPPRFAAQLSPLCGRTVPVYALPPRKAPGTGCSHPTSNFTTPCKKKTASAFLHADGSGGDGGFSRALKTAHWAVFARRDAKRRALRVALADFSATPWRGLEKSERCPSLASLFPPQAVVGSAAVRIHPLYKFNLVTKQKPQRIVYVEAFWWARVDCASRAAKNSPLGCFCAVFCDSAAAVRIHPLYESSLVTKQKPQRTCIR